MSMGKRLNFKDTKRTLYRLGVKITRENEGSGQYEYRVTFAGHSKDYEERIAYYTTDHQDALDTGIAMARRAGKE
jgi:hypothetical protein